MCWRDGRFDLLTAAEQLDELMRVTQYPKIRERLIPALAGRLVNDLRAIAVTVEELPVVDVSTDPHDNHLLGIAVYESTKIVTARNVLTMHGWLP